jgi:hypothetical protein
LANQDNLWKELTLDYAFSKAYFVQWKFVTKNYQNIVVSYYRNNECENVVYLSKSGVHDSNLMTGLKFFVVMFKGQNSHVFTYLNAVFRE